jgi:hypothetical protein
MDVTLNARLPQRITIAGGVSAGTYTTNNVVAQGPGVQSLSTSRCFVVDSPQELRFCDQPVPWLVQVKFLATTQLPHDVEVSGTFQTNPGPTVRAIYTVTSDQARPSLGHNLAAGVTTIDLIAPNSLIGERMFQVDLRLAKAFRFTGWRVKAAVDLFNALNSNAALLENPTYGPSWRTPTSIMPGRLIKFGVELSY